MVKGENQVEGSSSLPFSFASFLRRLLSLQPLRAVHTFLTSTISFSLLGFDMELMNRLGKGSESRKSRPSRASFVSLCFLTFVFASGALILPHRRYAMLSGEFRRDDDDHARYLGEDPSLTWDPDAEVRFFPPFLFIHLPLSLNSLLTQKLVFILTRSQAESSFYVHFSDW